VGGLSAGLVTGPLPGHFIKRAMFVTCRGPRGRPRHGLVSQARPARAKMQGRGPGYELAGCMANYIH
jgi:hypothetical protein